MKKPRLCYYCRSLTGERYKSADYLVRGGPSYDERTDKWWPINAWVCLGCYNQMKGCVKIVASAPSARPEE